MGETALRAGFHTEDKVGLAGAVVLHLLLVAVLALQFAFAPPRAVTPERMSVNLATEVSLESTAPDPVPESRAAIAPVLADVPAPPSEPATAPAPPVTVTPPPPPAPRAATRPQRPAPADPRPRRRPEPARQAPAPSRPAANAGGSRIGDSFLEGQGSSTSSDETRAPAATFGRAEQAALASAITRQLRPHWNAPSGVDADRLVSIVSWRLAEDGSLKGRPTCRTEAGSITESNRPQADLHCERAIRAVQLAAPFNLPAQFYSRWDDLEWQFDRRL
ncbi:energy transducer TonB [Qipengyuania sp. ASV99]|uniref:energy transducer TonB n=1 Tax=Qipengyuania sp. ASV99 TaxID=3399681 RepID=UPI003A4C8234